MDGILLNSILGVLLKKVIVPSDFKGRAEVVRLMQEDDVSGLVDSLTDFAVNTACVDFSIETKNEEFTKTLKQWLDEINKGYKGQIPVGVKELAREYFKERWKYSSFPVLKIAEWKEINGINVPTKMFFVDGESIHAEEKEADSDTIKLINYDYYLGDGTDHKLDKNTIFSRTNGRWFDKYPNPYLIKRGVYHNWKIVESLKNMQTKILEQVIPYLLLIKKGFQGTTPDTSKVYGNPELKEILKQFQTLMTEIKDNADGLQTKVPARATNFDEEIKHLIPDLKTIFDPVLFAQAERNMLSGLGFIDVIQGISDTRRESILNPKIFIAEVNAGVVDFKQILNQLVYLIKEKNKTHRKYIKADFYITASPVSIFQTDEFKNQMRMLWERGQLSSQTYCELVGETEYRTEIHRRKKESKEGLDVIMYPHIVKNQEDKGIDIPGKETEEDTDKNGKPIPTDKTDDKDKFDIGAKFEFPVICSKCNHIFDLLDEPEAGMGWAKCPKCGEAITQKDAIEKGKEIKDLIGAPYTTIKSLPSEVKKLSLTKQRKWMSVFNSAYRYKLRKTGDTKTADTYAVKVAWSQVKSSKRRKK